MVHDKIRIQLKFETAPWPPLLPGHDPVKTFMFLINKEECKQVVDVEKRICNKFSLSAINLFIHGCALISSEDVDVIRDNDEVLVISYSVINVEPKTKQKTAKIDKKLSISKSKELKKGNLSDVDLSPLPGFSVLPSTSLDESSILQLNEDRESCKKLKKSVKHDKKTQLKKDDPIITNPLSHRSGLSLNQNSVSELNKGEYSKKLKKQAKLKRSKLKNKPHSDDIQINMIKEEIELHKKKTKRGNSEKKKKLFLEKGHDPSSFFETMTPPRTEQEGMTNCESQFDLKNLEIDDKDNLTSTIKKKHKHGIIKPDSNKKQRVDGYSDRRNLLKNYDEMDTLSWPPRIGDLIAFKRLDVPEDGNPIFGGFQEGTVWAIDGIDPGSASLDIEMVNVSPKTEKNSRFEFNGYDDDPFSKKVERIAWGCLIDPRLVKGC